MKDILLKAVAHKNEVYTLLGMIDGALLSRGQLLVSAKMIELALRTLTEGDLIIKSVAFDREGKILLAAATTGGMGLSYVFSLKKLEISNGTADAYATYTETRQNGGLGGALLGITGKSGLSFALAKHNWIRIDDSNIRIFSRNLPGFIGCSLIRCAQSGILLKVY